MSTDTAFTPKSLTASEYVLELFEPQDNAAILGDLWTGSRLTVEAFVANYFACK